MEYQIISDGSCDLSDELVKENNIEVVPFYVTFDDINYYKEKEEMGIRDFYEKMVSNTNVFPKSSLPSIQDYVDSFKKYVSKNIGVICICITTKFSGSYNSACNAKSIILETYPNAAITVIDATINTVLQGLYVLEAARMKRDGVSYEAAVDYLEKIKSTGRILFTVGSMDYLKKGGRIGKVITVAGSKLGIRPIITLKEGEIFASGISRSRNKSLDKVLSSFTKHFETIKENPNNYNYAIGYGYDIEEAKAFRDKFLELLGTMSDVTEVPLAQIGAAIAVHTGPYPLGIGLIRRYDV